MSEITEAVPRARLSAVGRARVIDGAPKLEGPEVQGFSFLKASLQKIFIFQYSSIYLCVCHPRLLFFFSFFLLRPMTHSPAADNWIFDICLSVASCVLRIFAPIFFLCACVFLR